MKANLARSQFQEHMRPAVARSPGLHSHVVPDVIHQNDPMAVTMYERFEMFERLSYAKAKQCFTSSEHEQGDRTRSCWGNKYQRVGG